MTASQTVPAAAGPAVPDALAVLRQYFGFADFKPGQREVIGHLLAGQVGGGRLSHRRRQIALLPVARPAAAGPDAGRLAADRPDEGPDRRPGGPRHRRAGGSIRPSTWTNTAP